MLKVEFSNNSLKFLRDCNDELYGRLTEKVKSLAFNPYPKDRKRVGGRKEKIFRVRVGSYRILYIVFNERKVLFISDIDKRERVYD